MKEEIRFTIYGKPASQSRPRFFRRGRGIGSYDPNKKEKNDLVAVSKEYAPEKPFDVPVRVDIIAFFKRPKSHYRTGKYSHLLKPNAPKYHTSKPDWDNIGKFYCDAYNGLFWKDDSYVAIGSVRKLYTENEERTIIIIRLLT
jgi:Holliday junction resolvase RusA-like endonuclease